jgi:hypothetical protein
VRSTVACPISAFHLPELLPVHHGCVDDGVSPKQVDAYLMRSPSVNSYFEQRELSVRRVNAALNLVVSDRIASCGTAGCHSVAADTIATYRQVDGSGLFFWPSVDQCPVIFFHFPASELGTEVAVRSVILGYQDQAAGFAIKAMHDARSKLSPQLRK